MLRAQQLPLATGSHEYGTPGPQAVTNLWISDSRTYLLPDGTYEKDIYGQDVNYQNNGKWESIDNSLSLDSSGHYVNKANRFKVSFPKADNGTFSLNDGDYGITINNTNDYSSSYGVPTGYTELYSYDYNDDGAIKDIKDYENNSVYDTYTYSYDSK